MKYYDWSAHHADRRPETVAIIDLATKRELTYAQLDDRASRLASWLQGEGVAKGERVAILAPNCPEVFELEFASGKIGGVALPLNWRLTVPELEYILNDSSPQVLIYDASFKDNALELQKRCDIPTILEIDVDDPASGYEQAVAGSSSEPNIVELDLSDLAMIMKPPSQMASSVNKSAKVSGS